MQRSRLGGANKASFWAAASTEGAAAPNEEGGEDTRGGTATDDATFSAEQRPDAGIRLTLPQCSNTGEKKAGKIKSKSKEQKKKKTRTQRPLAVKGDRFALCSIRTPETLAYIVETHDYFKPYRAHARPRMYAPPQAWVSSVAPLRRVNDRHFLK